MAKRFAIKSGEFLRINASDIPAGLLVLDPRHFTGHLMTTDTKSKVVSIFVYLKKLSEKWFSHILLLICLILYACIGAWIFESVEGGHELQQNAIVRELRAPLNNMTDRLSKQLWNERLRYPLPDGNSSPLEVDSRWDRAVTKMLSQFEVQVTTTCKRGLQRGISHDQETSRWTFMGGLFFSMTVFTTIGYGDNPPKTRTGQAFTMVYAFIGIPLLLMVLADMGSIFTRGIKFIFKYIRRLYYTKSLRRVRRVGRSVGNMGRRATLHNIKYMDTAVGAINRGIAYIPYVPKSSKDNNENQNDKSIGLTKSPAVVFKNPGKKGPFIVRTDPTPPQTATASTPPVTPLPEDFLDIDDEFDLPITLAILILIIYLLIGAVIFWSSEKWSLLHAFYFVFISMSTIGFGDYVPSNQNVLLAAFIYLLFGLALTSMCINVVQIKLSATFQKAKLLVGETIGLDVQQIMQQELDNENKDKESRRPSKDTSLDKSTASHESSVEKQTNKTTKNKNLTVS